MGCLVVADHAVVGYYVTGIVVLVLCQTAAFALCHVISERVVLNQAVGQTRFPQQIHTGTLAVLHQLTVLYCQVVPYSQLCKVGLLCNYTTVGITIQYGSVLCLSRECLIPTAAYVHAVFHYEVTFECTGLNIYCFSCCCSIYNCLQILTNFNHRRLEFVGTHINGSTYNTCFACNVNTDTGFICQTFVYKNRTFQQ